MVLRGEGEGAQEKKRVYCFLSLSLSLTRSLALCHTFPPPMQEAKERVTHATDQSCKSHSQTQDTEVWRERTSQRSTTGCSERRRLGRGDTARLPYVWLLTRLHSKFAISCI